MKNLRTLHNDSLFAVQFRNSVSKTRAILLFTIKIIEMFELHASMPSMQSADYQAKIPQKFPIIIHNYANVETINQSKSLPGFRVVVTSLDGLAAAVASDVAETRKRLRGNRMNFRLSSTRFSVHIYSHMT